jgi:hypothetical protein
MTVRKQHIGIKYGHLTGLEYVRTDSKDGAAIWKWQCDCGNHKEIKAKVVTAGRTLTCGGCQLKHKLKAASQSTTLQKNRRVVREFQRYIRVSQKKGIKWALSLEEFNRLSLSNCSLCNTPPPSSGRNKIEPVGIESGYTEGQVYTRCRGCDITFHKVELSLLIERIAAVSNNLLT